MKNKGINIAITSLACLTVISLAGSSLGTLAWYAFSTRATLAYSGTAVQQTEQLQIGLKWSRSTEDVRAINYKTMYKATFDDVGTDTYCFMPAGLGFSNKAVSEYLSLHGYATNELSPLTTKSYNTGDPLTLYEAPSTTSPTNATLALKEHYVGLPFAFRIKTTEDSGQPVYAKNQTVWITDASAEVDDPTLSGKDVKQAIRLHVYNPDGATGKQRFIVNPTADHTDTSKLTYVGGLLDLNGDGLYDYTSQTVGGTVRIQENLYGEWTSDTRDRILFNNSTATYDDINSVFPANERASREENGVENESTFFAKHAENVWGFSGDYTGIARGEAHYLSFDQVVPTESGGGAFDGGYPIAFTGTTGVGVCMITVWLEGWDHSIVDSNIGAKFNLGLQFEINRV